MSAKLSSICRCAIKKKEEIDETSPRYTITIANIGCSFISFSMFYVVNGFDGAF